MYFIFPVISLLQADSAFSCPNCLWKSDHNQSILRRRDDVRIWWWLKDDFAYFFMKIYVVGAH